MRVKINGGELFEIVGKSHSCVVYKLPVPIIFKQTRKCECEKVAARAVWAGLGPGIVNYTHHSEPLKGGGQSHE